MTEVALVIFKEASCNIFESGIGSYTYIEWSINKNGTLCSANVTATFISAIFVELLSLVIFSVANLSIDLFVTISFALSL